MYTPPARFSTLRNLVTTAVALAIVGGGVLIGLGCVRVGEPEGIRLIAGGGVLILASVLAEALMWLVLKIEGNTLRQYDAQRDLREEIHRLGDKLDNVIADLRLSDRAKTVVYRDHERQALRQAVSGVVSAQEWESALALLEEFDQQFGASDMVEHLRREVVRARSDAMRQKLAQATGHVHELMDCQEWDRARHEVSRLHAVLPDERRVTELQDELQRRFDECKQTLLVAFNDAAGVDDIDRAIGILKELDRYLTPEEARSLEKSARDVFKEKLMQLRLQFHFAVNDKRWRHALETGAQIVEEFPNSRMAAEVQEHVSVLRQRAGLPADVEVVASQNPAAER